MLAIDFAVLAALAVGSGTVAVVAWTFGRLQRDSAQGKPIPTSFQLGWRELDDIYEDFMTPSHRIEVLYVEDSAGDVLITKLILGEFLQPVKLTIATDGEQALAILADERFQPALIILDLNLPKVSGFEVLSQNPRKDIPVVIFSASMRASDIERTLSLGAKAYVEKPFDMPGYRDAVLGMVRNWAVPASGAVTA
jgi:CheY-like chemotaxis protein